MATSSPPSPTSDPSFELVAAPPQDDRPWKIPIPKLLIKSPIAPLPTAILIDRMQYAIERHDAAFYTQQWPLAHSRLLGIIEILNTHADNEEFVNFCVSKVRNVNTKEQIFAYFDRRLFFSEIRRGEYDAAWAILPRLKFEWDESPKLSYETCKGVLLAVGFLERAIDTSSARDPMESQETIASSKTRDWLLNQAEFHCMAAMRAALEGNVVPLHHMEKNETYALMAVIKQEQSQNEEAAFWKSLLLSDNLQVERDLVFFPAVSRWWDKFKAVEDVRINNYPRELGDDAVNYNMNEGTLEQTRNADDDVDEEGEDYEDEEDDGLLKDDLHDELLERLKTRRKDLDIKEEEVD